MASPIVSVTHLEVFLNRKVLYQKRRQYAIYFSQVKVIHMVHSLLVYTILCFKILQTNKVYEANQISLHEGLNRRTKL